MSRNTPSAIASAERRAGSYWAASWERRLESALAQVADEQWVHPGDLIDDAQAELQAPIEPNGCIQFVEMLMSTLPDRDNPEELSRRMVRFTAFVERLVPSRGYGTATDTAKRYRLHLRVVKQERALVDSLLRFENRAGPFCLPPPVEVPRDAFGSSCVTNSKNGELLSAPSGTLLRLPTDVEPGMAIATAFTTSSPSDSSMDGAGFEKNGRESAPPQQPESKRAA